MSDVISFRLSRENPREAKALQVLDSWNAEGYSVRYILTEALLKLNDSDQEMVANNTANDLNTTLDQVRKLLENFGNCGHLGPVESDEGSAPSTLTDNFIESILKVVKPGLNHE